VLRFGRFGPLLLVLTPLVVLVARVSWACWRVRGHSVTQTVVATVVATILATNLATFITVVTFSRSAAPVAFPAGTSLTRAGS
jgi:hypothetical protein